jgi:hypothetical protein
MLADPFAAVGIATNLTIKTHLLMDSTRIKSCEILFQFRNKILIKGKAEAYQQNI